MKQKQILTPPTSLRVLTALYSETLNSLYSHRLFPAKKTADLSLQNRHFKTYDYNRCNDVYCRCNVGFLFCSTFLGKPKPNRGANGSAPISVDRLHCRLRQTK